LDSGPAETIILKESGDATDMDNAGLDHHHLGPVGVLRHVMSDLATSIDVDIAEQPIANKTQHCNLLRNVELNTSRPILIDSKSTSKHPTLREHSVSPCVLFSEPASDGASSGAQANEAWNLASS
jgi:hypothetical protein